MTWAEAVNAESGCRCAFCGRPITEEDDWWIDDEGDLVCEGPDGSLGPHQPGEPDATLAPARQPR